jgi:hypothetical protein
MRWPKHPTESVRPSRFRPPHCPWPACPDHFGHAARFQRNGWYRLLHDPARIPRFRCKTCRRSCSRSTFSATYYLKRRDLPPLVAAGLVACSAHRQMARSFQCSKTTVTRLAERLSRHAILFQARSLAELPAVEEAIVHDHFETFIGRQDHALGIGTAVGATSWFVYDVDFAPHRGSGRRPDRQPLERAVPNHSYVASIRRTVQTLLPKISASSSLQLIVDGRVDYSAALKLTGLTDRVPLRVYPNPKRGPKGRPRSPAAISRDLFPVDALHQLIRHSNAEHKRETIAFGRRLESIVGRAHLMAIWKNFIKSRSERRPDRTTPAMKLGLTDTRWRWERIFARRLFTKRLRLSESTIKLYWKQLSTHLPALDRKHAA